MRPKRGLIRPCKWCGTELGTYEGFCSYRCKADYYDAEADHDREIKQLKEWSS